MENLTPRQSYQPAPAVRTSIGRYQIDSVLGRGGMGEVVKVLDPGTGKYVAVKILDAEAYRDEDLLARFRREAASALSLDHVNIAKFYGLEHDEENRPIIVMEFIDGEPMDRWLKQNHDAPFSQLVGFVIQAARGLENAYRRSIIHRDIKPSNLIVNHEGVVKIIDFGLAKSMWDTSGLTGTGMVVGTPRYISPEQGMGRNVDHRSDIYSLGATLYELLTRQAPFDGETPMAIMLKHINTPLVPPYLVNPRIPGDVNEIVIRMMAKDPKERYQDYEPLIRDLESAKIHRMAKERRSAGLDTQFAGHAATAVYGGNAGDPPETMMQSRPSSYLTEGLVDVRYEAPEEHTQSNLTKILLVISGLVIVGIAVGAFMAPKAEEGKKKPSVLSQKIASMLKKDNAVEDDGQSAAQMAKDDAEKVRTTSSRMEGLLSKLLEQRAAKPGEAPTLRSLRDNGQLTKEEMQDAWGNDLYIVQSSTGEGTLYSNGRDGVEKTDDDFRFTLNGSTRKVPKVLTAEDFKTEEPAKGSAGQ